MTNYRMWIRIKFVLEEKKTKTVVAAAAVTLYAACITKVKKSMIHNEIATSYYNALSIVCFCRPLPLHPSFYRYIL